jgi:hypothetical protein
MGERKKKKRGQQRDIIVPLPLESALNRLTNRAGRCRAKITLRDREADLVELDLGIGFFRDRRNRNEVNEFWKTRLTMESIDPAATQVTYNTIHLQGDGIVLLFLYLGITLGLVFLDLLNLADGTNVAFVMISVALWIVTLVVMWARLIVLKRLLHNLDQPLRVR